MSAQLAYPLPHSLPSLPSIDLSPSFANYHSLLLSATSASMSQPSPLDAHPLSYFPLSSNPPNPRVNFRLGDWICCNPQCSAHNFGRNISCIGCGNSRSDTVIMPPQDRSNSSASRTVISPRFSNFGQDANPGQQQTVTRRELMPLSGQQQLYNTVLLSQNSVGPRASHPLLTPSGRNFASGGRVQNISSDPANPCVMYWPDNEPFPEQGQIRPSASVAVPQPPIMNTGNRGPISHQPGDWICGKCNYLNWRRRKVCQTCLPYAEGNGDSISAAVQAERISLLTNVLSQTQTSPQRSVRMVGDTTRTGAGFRTTTIGGPAATPATPTLDHPVRAHSLTPPQIQRRFADLSPPLPRAAQRGLHRAHSQFELGEHYSYSDIYTAQPIYQTSGRRQKTTIPSASHENRDLSSLSEPSTSTEPAYLLPSSILHDNQDAQEQVVLPPSPSLSPSSTSSSTDLSIDSDYESLLSGAHAFSTLATLGGQSHSVTSSASDNIWRFDGEETKSLNPYSLPSRENILTSTRRVNQRDNNVIRAKDTEMAFNNNVYNIRN